ncbi:MAG TPA: response regulator transcription factor [Propionibacteriaceae bacterium]
MSIDAPTAEGRAASTVLIVDDHPIVRRGLVSLLSVEPWVRHVYEAASAAEAVREAVLHQVDVVAMDLRLGDRDGVEATQKLLAARPGATVVMVSMVADVDQVARALEAGARGYVLKTSPPEDICAALDLARRGGVVLGSGLGPAVLTSGGNERQLWPAPFDALSPRELALAQQLARGEPNARIARTLGVSEKTVRNQVSSLLVKLEVPDRVAAVLLAREAGFAEARRTREDRS